MAMIPQAESTGGNVIREIVVELVGNGFVVSVREGHQLALREWVARSLVELTGVVEGAAEDLARAAGLDLSVTPSEALLSVARDVLDARSGMKRKPRGEGGDRLEECLVQLRLLVDGGEGSEPGGQDEEEEGEEEPPAPVLQDVESLHALDDETNQPASAWSHSGISA